MKLRQATFPFIHDNRVSPAISGQQVFQVVIVGESHYETTGTACTFAGREMVETCHGTVVPRSGRWFADRNEAYLHAADELRAEYHRRLRALTNARQGNT